jgi:glycosyltransferase involved in cell wall biosynthesis
MPLPDEPWARGKCGYKLIQYMACGLPVVASPVGVNAEIVEEGVNGFLARDMADWAAALRRLVSDPALRAAMGQEGRAKIEREYSLQVQGPRLAGLIRDVVDRARSG